LLRRRATARGGSGGQSGGVAEAGTANAGSGKVAVRQGKMRGRAQSGAGVAGALHMAGTAAAGRGRETEEMEREVDEGGLKWNFSKESHPEIPEQDELR
jgi:hypothetical protein